MPATIYDVARKAGVSIGTVSLALKNHPRVKEVTRKQVATIADKLNYRPNALGRALALQRSHTLGLVITDISNPFFGQLVEGVEEVVHKNGYNILLGNSRYDSSTERAFIENLMGNRAEGLIVGASEIGSNIECFEELKRHEVPVVFLRRLKDFEADYVMVDDEKAAYEVTTHLINLGYATIGYIGNTYSCGADHDRFTGYKRALEAKGLVYDRRFVRETGFKIDDGYKATKSLMSEANRPRAVVAFCDLTAIGALEAALEEGVRVPEDLAVVGFDDIEFAARCQVPLTTMALPKRELGRQAVELLLQRIKEKKEKGRLENEVRHIILEAKLVVRKSCGAHLTA